MAVHCFPILNRKVERFHLTKQKEFYQLIPFSDTVDLNKILEHCILFYIFDRPLSAFDSKTPYEVPRSKLKN